jgi:hypothetical protein
MEPGAVMNMSRCQMRCNLHNGLVVTAKGDVTVAHSRFVDNAWYLNPIPDSLKPES